MEYFEYETYVKMYEEIPTILDSSFWDSVSAMLLNIFIATYTEWGLIHILAGTVIVS